MKHIILAAFVFLYIPSFARNFPAKSDSFALLINDKNFNSGDTIRTEDLKSLAGMQLVNKNTQQQYKPREFEWVISLEDQIAKNLSTDKNGWQRLPGLLSRMDSKSIVFIDNIKWDLPDMPTPPTFNLIPK